MLNKKVDLLHCQFNDERRRVFDIANLLPLGGRGEVALFPNLRFAQCWWLINRLRRHGFEVTPEGENDGQGKCLFRLNENGELVLHLVRTMVNTPQQASAAQIVHVSPLNAEAPKPSPKHVLLRDDGEGENSPRQKTQDSKQRSRGQKNFQNAQRVSEILGQIRKQRYSSDGDWS